MRSDRRPTAYLHVGPHKTGTSTIQTFIRANFETLDRAGLFFPMLRDADGRPARNHIDLMHGLEIGGDGDLKPGARLWPEIERVADAGEKDVLLSSEMFCNAFANGRKLDRVLRFFEKRGYRIVVLGYLRDQPFWLNSWYVQHQKRLMGEMSFMAFADESWRAGRCDPYRYLAPFIGNPRVTLVGVSFDAASRAGLVDDFLRRVGVPQGLATQEPGIVNVNAGAKTIHAAQEIMRRAGPGLVSLDGYSAAYGLFKRRFQALDWRDTPHVELDGATAALVRERYREINERFAAHYLDAPWAELQSARDPAPSRFAPEAASASERAEIELLVRTIVRRFAIARMSARVKRGLRRIMGAGASAEAADGRRAGG